MRECIYVPIFEKDGNKFFIATDDFTASNESDAIKIGYGSMLVEGILLNFKFKGETREVDINNTPHIKSTLGILPVALLEGPIFDQDGK